MAGFSFGFSGDDIGPDNEEELQEVVKDLHISSSSQPNTTRHPPSSPELTQNGQAAETGTLRRKSASSPSSAFPIEGQKLLPPVHHDLKSMLEELPERISYGTLTVLLSDSKGEIRLRRRELWDVRVQIMSEDEGGEKDGGNGEGKGGLEGLGERDVKTGVYEGGFKSWESSVDVVKVLGSSYKDKLGGVVLELGCGTSLPSLAIFQWFLLLQQQNSSSSSSSSSLVSKQKKSLHLGLADYNPTVLQLVTLPNILLSWAQNKNVETWEEEGELEITPELIDEFQTDLLSNNITISFFSGAWSAEFVSLVLDTINTFPVTSTINTTSPTPPSTSQSLLVIGAETIYSPSALTSFGETLTGLMEGFPGTNEEKKGLVAAKKVYFGVGGSMEDFLQLVNARGYGVNRVREESDGVRREVVEVLRSGRWEMGVEGV